MNKIYLISANYIKNTSEIGTDVEAKFINRSILSSQDLYLQGILGTELYNIVLDAAYEYVVNSTPIEDRIATLLDTYVINHLLYATLKDCLPYIYFKISPKTVGTNSGDNTTPVEYALLNALRADYDEKYNHYSNRMVAFLNENDDIYPEWGYLNTDGEKQNMIPKNGESYTGGMCI